ncbi:NAD dependent epimerase/dehydratase [Jeotgalibacillus alimentarius]|uniref:NAD dependent epimerase/dehydratase n=1 Tax=Jeotgalibacillus alimentarius TaxID=135826 RepID=A0A0C2RF67_9BACL|nr:SDR family oxidoreductase [Jeotgalibacillus alimentarius]KIL48840.1 NAD dependent epimerase/dehydratase [Jeotgalibacillus alimentarius]
MDVLVIGANGTTGRLTVDLLAKRNKYYARGMVRKEDQFEEIEKLGGLPVKGDLEGDFEQAFDEVDAVIFAAGSGGHTGPDKTKAVDEEGAIKAIDLAVQKGISKFVMLSAIGAGDLTSMDIPEDMEDYYLAKQAADRHLEKSGLNYTIVRPGLLTDNSGTGKIRAAEVLENRNGEITRSDVAKVLVAALEHENLNNRAVEILNDEEDLMTALNRV